MIPSETNSLPGMVASLTGVYFLYVLQQSLYFCVSKTNFMEAAEYSLIYSKTILVKKNKCYVFLGVDREIKDGNWRTF